MKRILNLLLILFSFGSCAQEAAESEKTTTYKIHRSEEEWKEILSPEEYKVLREEGTEMAFTGKYVDWKKKGTFVCKACGNPLFSSDTKFKSGTGWPSFYNYLDENSVLEVPDNKFGWNRTEVECQNCGSHLGHVFEDGPDPTGLRYCINSVSLEFVED